MTMQFGGRILRALRLEFEKGVCCRTLAAPEVHLKWKVEGARSRPRWYGGLAHPVLQDVRYVIRTIAFLPFSITKKCIFSKKSACFI